ncbi:MAG: sulfotransferase [Acidimicrobiia bacterium]
MTDHADQLVAQAKTATGLDDFGEDTWSEGLQQLVRSADADGRYTDIGRMAFEAEVVRNLRNRLLIEQLYADHPEIDDQDCTVELLGVGFPRTGSTALAAMLGEDHRVRHLRMWEAGDPMPPPGLDPDADARRIADGVARIEMQDMMEPRFKSMLPQSATGPLEDHDLVAISFQSQHFIAMSWVPTYAEWLLQCDMVPAYRYERRVLKVLQWKQGPTRWWLKSPTHSLFLAQREEVFPETRYVMTHRDVSKVLPSVADLYTVMLGFMHEGIDPLAVGALNMDQWGTALDRMFAYRDGRDDRFFDIGFTEFQADPIAQIRSLYEWIGADFTSEVEAAMLAWRAANPRDGARHEYRAEEFGMDDASIAARFGAYRERFGPLL